jgi:hypothetical protein
MPTDLMLIKPFLGSCRAVADPRSAPNRALVAQLQDAFLRGQTGVPIYWSSCSFAMVVESLTP